MIELIKLRDILRNRVIGMLSTNTLHIIAYISYQQCYKELDQF